MKVSIIGLGWFGAELAKALIPTHEIYGTTRSEEKKEFFTSQGIHTQILIPPHLPSKEMLEADVVVINIPPFENQLEWFKKWTLSPRSFVIFISTTSVYGDVSGLVNEESPIRENPLENWVRSLSRSTIIRFGGLIGLNRHPGKILSGRKNIAGGNWPVNLVHIADTVAFTKLIIEQKKESEIYNLVYPYHPTRRDYYENYCRENYLPLPEFIDSDQLGKTISSLKVDQFYKWIQKP